MQIKNSLNNISPFSKIMLMIATSVGSTLILFLALFAINLAFFHIPMDFSLHLSENSNPEYILAAKVMQMVSQLSMFIVPAIIFAYLTSNSISLGLSLNLKTNVRNMAIVILITLLAIPFINLLAQWNMDWHLPDFMKNVDDWMRQTQKANDEMISLLARMDSTSDIIINILMMAILPALGEELIFRGILQPQIIKLVKNPHVGIILTAVLFSAFHVQFLGFFSRAILGALFGYLYFYSNNMKYPILAHFINNFLALSLVFAFGTEVDQASFQNPYEPSIVIVSIGTFLTGLFLFAKTKKQFATLKPIDDDLIKN